MNVAAAGTSTGYVFAVPYPMPSQGGPLIFDNRGEVVWFHPLDPLEGANLQVQRYRGRQVLTWWQGTINSVGQGRGEGVIVDHTYRRVATVRAGNGLSADLHELLLTAQDTALITAFAPRHADLSTVGGASNGQVAESVIQEIDVSSGRVVFQWRSLDHVAVTESYQPRSDPYDYFHANSVAVDRDGHLLISARNTHAVYKVNRQTGAVIWRLGGKRSDFEMKPGTGFAWQHDARRQPDGTITLFDDEAAPAVGKQSRGLALAVDETRRSASLAHEYRHPHPLLADSQGNTQELPNGNVFVGWGAQPYFTEFSRSGRPLFDAHIQAPRQSYRAYRYPWTAAPAAAPALVVASTGIAYASWNGATQVARWQLLGGSSPSTLSVLGTYARTGFETPLPTGGHARAWYAVHAVDAAGRRLSQSEPVRA